MWCSAVGFIVTLTLSLLAAPLAAKAQALAKVPRIGWLASGAPLSEEQRQQSPFFQGLRELGWVEGKNIAIEQRGAEGNNERLPALAAELVQLRVDVIVAGDSGAIPAAKHATNTIPIVMTISGDPVASWVHCESCAAGWEHHRAHCYGAGARWEATRAAHSGCARHGACSCSRPVEPVRMVRAGRGGPGVGAPAVCLTR